MDVVVFAANSRKNINRTQEGKVNQPRKCVKLKKTIKIDAPKSPRHFVYTSQEQNIPLLG
jgi:hypothetical protein